MWSLSLQSPVIRQECPVEGLGYKPRHKPFDLQFVLPTICPGAKMVQKLWEWPRYDGPLSEHLLLQVTWELCLSLEKGWKLSPHAVTSFLLSHDFYLLVPKTIPLPLLKPQSPGSLQHVPHSCKPAWFSLIWKFVCCSLAAICSLSPSLGLT